MDPYRVYAALMLEKFRLPREFVFFKIALHWRCLSVLSYCILSICVVLFAVAHCFRAQNNLSQTIMQLRCCVSSEDLH